MAEARERAPYFALNALRTDAGSPLCLVLHPDFLKVFWSFVERGRVFVIQRFLSCSRGVQD